MKFTPAELDGTYIIEFEPKSDGRGFFARVFCEEEMRAHGLEPHIAQCNISWNERRGTLRGMHYQAAPYEETKIVRCTRGAIWDVVVDLRPHSATFEKWMSVTLDETERRMLYIPRGFAHGFITLKDDTEVFYWMGRPHVAENARGVAWDDPTFAIEWPFPPEVISENDRNHPRWKR